MNETQQLLVCPNCQSLGKRQILGSLRPDGSLLILRHSHGTTLIQAASLSLGCGCGFVFTIAQGAVQTNYAPSYES